MKRIIDFDDKIKIELPFYGWKEISDTFAVEAKIIAILRRHFFQWTNVIQHDVVSRIFAASEISLAWEYKVYLRKINGERDRFVTGFKATNS